MKESKNLIVELVLNEDSFDGLKVIKDIYEFKELSDVIVANRIEKAIEDVKNRVITRDIYNSDK